MVGKIYARIVSDRLKVLTNALVMDEQGAFRAGTGCIDQVFAVRQVFPWQHVVLCILLCLTMYTVTTIKICQSLCAINVQTKMSLI